jgi:hypothetical protein
VFICFFVFFLLIPHPVVANTNLRIHGMYVCNFYGRYWDNFTLYYINSHIDCDVVYVGSLIIKS